MASVSYSFVDIAVLDQVRERFAAGDALLILTTTLDTVIWANGPGAALIGHRNIDEAIGAESGLATTIRRQISATPGFPRISGERAVATRLGRGVRSPIVNLSASTIVLPGGEAAILLACKASSTRIGRDSYVGPGASVQCAMVGDRVILHAGVRIGQDGFGYLPGARGLEKLPQIGRVVIQDDVEIGANTTVDRGALVDTVIGQGTKIDNLVQVAHNVRIGRSCIIAGNCGLSGSVTLGDFVMLGGRVGIADHINIGTGAQLAASSGVMNDVPPGERWAGSPAQPIREAFRELAALRGLVDGKRKKMRDGDE